MKRCVIGLVMVCCLTALPGTVWSTDYHNGAIFVNALVWLKDAGCLERMNWQEATERVKTLAHGQCGLTDKSQAGDWRLPTIDELKAISASISQFTNVQSYYYWSSTNFAYNSNFAEAVYVPTGRSGTREKDWGLNVLPVRSTRTY